MWVSGPNWGALVASIGQIASTVPPLSTVDETLPDPVPALHPFLTGNSVTFEAGNSGNLWFTINDDASGGNYSDNAGTLGVQLTMVPEPATWAMLVVGISLLIGTLRVAVAHHGPPLARCGNRSTTSFSRTPSK